MDSPMVRITRDAVTNILNLLGEEDDERLKLDTLEGETPLFDFIQLLMDGIEHDEGVIEQLGQQIAARKVRAERAGLRIEQRKNLILSLMETARLSKIPLPEATVWTSERKPTFKVTDVEQLPKGYFTIETVRTRKPNKDKIAAAFEKGVLLAGVTKTNGMTVLNTRRK